MRDMLDDAADLSGQGERVAVAMVVDTRRSAPRPLGSRLFVTESGEMRGSVSGGCVESDVVLRAQEVLRDGTPALVQYGITGDDAFDVGLPCGGEIEVFIAPFDGDAVARTWPPCRATTKCEPFRPGLEAAHISPVSRVNCQNYSAISPATSGTSTHC